MKVCSCDVRVRMKPICSFADEVTKSFFPLSKLHLSVPLLWAGRENRKFSYKPTTEFQIWPLIYPECEPVQRNQNKTTKQLQTTNTV